MIKISIKLNGIDYKLPDPINEAKIPRLRKIETKILETFKPVLSVYPDADFFIIWNDDVVINQMAYVSTSVPVAAITSILKKSAGKHTQN
jgi:hypothetical protein